MGEQVVAVDVERCGFDVLVQVFEFALIALFASSFSWFLLLLARLLDPLRLKAEMLKLLGIDPSFLVSLSLCSSVCSRWLL